MVEPDSPPITWILQDLEDNIFLSRGVLLAFWAFETDYGAVQGDIDTLAALATLAHDCRRPALFRPQLHRARVTTVYETLERPLVPIVKPVHDRLGVEIARGCTRSCRFCQAGMIYRPVRERTADEVLQAVDEMIEHCGFEEVSFLSLSSSEVDWVTSTYMGSICWMVARGAV